MERLPDVLALLLFMTAVFVNESAFAKPRPPLPPHPEVWLNAWRFDDPEWLTNARTAPLAFLDAVAVESWSGHALSFSGPNNALLALPERASDGATNFFPARGAIRFWFAPDWTSAPEGSGPGVEARLLEFGAWSGNGAVGWWALGISPAGNALRFFAHGAGGTETVLEAPIHWCAGEWHQVTLAWSATAHPLYFYFPSIAANCASDMVMGFSGSSSNSFIDAYYAWRPAIASSMSAPVLIQAGAIYYDGNRWGDYSSTTLDPDGLGIWTVQQFAVEEEFWATWIAKIAR